MSTDKVDESGKIDSQFMKRTPDDIRQNLWNYLHTLREGKKSKIALDLWWLVSALVILDKCGLLGGAPDRSTEPSELGEAFAKLFPKSNNPTRNLSLLLKSEVVQLLASYENTGHPLGAIPGALRKISLPKEALKAVNFLDQKGPEVEAPLDLDSIWVTMAKFMEMIAFDSHKSYFSNYVTDDLIASSLAHAKNASVIDLYACSGETAVAFAGPDTELSLLTEKASTGIVAVARVLVAGQSVDRLKIYVGHPRGIQVENRKWDVVIAAPALWPSEQPNSVVDFDLGYLEAAMDLLPKGGKAVVHLPLSVLSGKKSQKLRQRLLEDYRVDCLVHEAFDDVTEVVKDSTLLFFTKTRPSLRTQMIDSWDFYEVFRLTKDGSILKNCFIAAIRTFLEIGLDSSASEFKTKRREFLKNLAHQAKNLLEGLELSTVPSDNLAYDVGAATAGLRLVNRAIKCLDGHGTPIDEASHKEQPLVAEIIARGYDLRYSMTSVADYERFLDQAEKKHDAQILTLDQIGVIRSGINCPTSHLTKKGSPTQVAESRVVRVVTACNDRGSNNRQLQLIDLETTLVPEVAVALSDDELLRDGDLLVALIGYPGKIKRVRDICSDLIESGILIPAVATNRYAILHLHDSFKADLGGFEMVAKLLASEPYQEAFKTLAVGDRTKKIDVATLGKFKIPLLPPEKRLLLDLALNEEEVTIEAMLGAMNKALISVDAIRCFTGTPEWRQFSEQASTATTGELRSELGRLVSIHAKEVLGQGLSQDDPFLDWIRQFTGVADSLEQILKHPLTAEQILSLQQWRSKLSDAKCPYESAWATFREAIELDPEKIRDAVLTQCKKVIEAVRTLSRRCERELTSELQAQQERARSISELWDMMRGSRLGGEEQYAYPFLWKLMLDGGTNDLPAQMDRHALDQLLAVFSSRSIIHEQACAWFENILPRIPESDWIATIRHFGNCLTDVDKATAKPLIQDLLQEVEARAWRMTGWNSYPKELLAFIVEAARIPVTGTVYVPYTPSFGFSRFLPSNTQGFFQFRSEHEAGIFAIHEVISEGHSAFVVADPRSEGTPFDESFSAVIAAPPLTDRIGRNEDPTEIRCIKNALSVIKPGGRAVVCVGPSFLMRSGRYAEYREHLTRSKLIEAVIQLPSRLISGSSLSLSLLILDKSADRSKETLFIDASDCIVSGGSDRFPQLNVEKLLTRFSDGQHPSCRRVNEEGIRAKDYDLTPARYIPLEEPEVPEHHRLCSFGELVSPKRFPRCQAGDRGVLLTQKLLMSQSSVEPQSFENLDVLDAESFTNSATFNRLDSDALIISPIYSKDGFGACLFNHNGKDLFLRSDMMTFEISSDKVDPEWLMLAFGSELTRRQLEPLVYSAGIPRIRRALLMDLVLAVPDTMQQQRTLLALHKESSLKSRAKELGLEEHIQSIKKAFLDDLRLKRHSISQVTNEIKSAIAVILDELDKKGSISAEQIISPRRSINFGDYLQGMSQKCGVLSNLVDKLTEENKHEPFAPLNLVDAMKKVEKEYRGEKFQLKFSIESSSFLDQTTGRSLKPIINIGENDFQILCRNIIDNAKRHAFKGDFTGASILVDAELLHEDQMVELCFMNNGAPFPKGMDLERFVLRGEKAGLAGNTGTGGYHIKSIMDYVGGRLEICTPPFDEYSTEIRLLFPISHDDTL